jgi:hypothetical protein
LKVYLSPQLPIYYSVDNGLTWHQGGTHWTTDLTADQPVSFTAHLLFDEEGIYGVQALLLAAQGEVVIYGLNVQITSDGGTIYLPDTSFPKPTGPEIVSPPDPILLATLRARPTETEAPTLTPLPTEPLNPEAATPTSPAYPPPPPGTPYP